MLEMEMELECCCCRKRLECPVHLGNKLALGCLIMVGFYLLTSPVAGSRAVLSDRLFERRKSVVANTVFRLGEAA